MQHCLRARSGSADAAGIYCRRDVLFSGNSGLPPRIVLTRGMQSMPHTIIPESTLSRRQHRETRGRCRADSPRSYKLLHMRGSVRGCVVVSGGTKIVILSGNSMAATNPAYGRVAGGIWGSRAVEQVPPGQGTSLGCTARPSQLRLPRRPPATPHPQGARRETVGPRRQRPRPSPPARATPTGATESQSKACTLYPQRSRVGTWWRCHHSAGPLPGGSMLVLESLQGEPGCAAYDQVPPLMGKTANTLAGPCQLPRARRPRVTLHSQAARRELSAAASSLNQVLPTCALNPKGCA